MYVCVYEIAKLQNHWSKHHGNWHVYMVSNGESFYITYEQDKWRYGRIIDHKKMQKNDCQANYYVIFQNKLNIKKKNTKSSINPLWRYTRSVFDYDIDLRIPNFSYLSINLEYFSTYNRIPKLINKKFSLKFHHVYIK